MMMPRNNKQTKEKKFVRKQIQICINCGSSNTDSSDFTLYCNDCGALNFYEVI